MPLSYAVQRSLPISILRSTFKLSRDRKQTPSCLGRVGKREGPKLEDPFVYQIAQRTAQDHLSDAYPSFEQDWFLALEIQTPWSVPRLSCPVRCWHGLDDPIVPVGAVMWMQRQCKQTVLFAVQGATHNTHLDVALVQTLFQDIQQEAKTLGLTCA